MAKIQSQIKSKAVEFISKINTLEGWVTLGKWSCLYNY
jgi:hypothetical protein